MSQTVLFIGVTTSQSLIMRIFPRWMEALGIEARIEGVDLPLDAPPERYRQVVRRIAGDKGIAGAVITSHKLRLYDAASDLLTPADQYVTICREVNAVSCDGGTLAGHALDPPASASVLHEMMGPGYWAEHPADVLCFGAGGAATAIALSLFGALDRAFGELVPAPSTPRRLVFVDREAGRLRALRRVIDRVNRGAPVQYHCHARAAINDTLLADLAPGSLVINATGMGKDRPGSPLTAGAVFPQHAVVWDLNYRGALQFLELARSQVPSRSLAVYDGWRYFLHGWTTTLSVVLQHDLTRQRFASLTVIAEEVRGGPIGFGRTS